MKVYALNIRKYIQIKGGGFEKMICSKFSFISPTYHKKSLFYFFIQISRVFFFRKMCFVLKPYEPYIIIFWNNYIFHFMRLYLYCWNLNPLNVSIYQFTIKSSVRLSCRRCRWAEKILISPTEYSKSVGSTIYIMYIFFVYNPQKI